MNIYRTNLHMLGPQGSGKGTQSEILAKKTDFIHISAGDLLRKRTLIDDEFAHHLKNILDSGELVPFGIIERVHEEKISLYPDTVGFIFDGILRNLEQTNAMTNLWKKLKLDEPFLIVLEISDAQSIERLNKRRVCPKCGFIAIAQSNAELICKRCGTKMIQRSDDTKEAILNRLEIYHQETEPVIDYFRSKNRLIIINGSPSIEIVSESIIKKLYQKQIIQP